MTSASDTAILHTIASYEAGIATLRSAAAGLTHAQLNTRIVNIINGSLFFVTASGTTRGSVV